MVILTTYMKNEHKWFLTDGISMKLSFLKSSFLKSSQFNLAFKGWYLSHYFWGFQSKIVSSTTFSERIPRFFFDSLEIPGDAIVGLNRIKSPRIHEQKFRWCTQPLYSRLSFPMFGFSMKFLSCYQGLSRNINKFEMSFSDIFIIESNWKKFYSDYARRLLIKRKGWENFLERCLIS